jgi:hypothetical protein
MNSKTFQSTETWTEIARLFARLPLGASFLSTVADRFGLWEPYGAKNVSWGTFLNSSTGGTIIAGLLPFPIWSQVLAWKASLR